MATHHILISVGSNIDRTYYTNQAIKALKATFEKVLCSSVYESESVGFQGSPFYNLVVSAHTHLAIEDVCKALKNIEKDNGRKHGEKKFCSRTLDLDLLTYDNVVTQSPVILPREEITYNAFVLWPLAELLPNDIHPVTQKSYSQMWQAFDKTKQALWPVEFNWK